MPLPTLTPTPSKVSALIDFIEAKLAALPANSPERIPLLDQRARLYRALRHAGERRAYAARHD